MDRTEFGLYNKVGLNWWRMGGEVEGSCVVYSWFFEVGNCFVLGPNEEQNI